MEEHDLILARRFGGELSDILERSSGALMSVLDMDIHDMTLLSAQDILDGYSRRDEYRL